MRDVANYTSCRHSKFESKTALSKIRRRKTPRTTKSPTTRPATKTPQTQIQLYQRRRQNPKAPSIATETIVTPSAKIFASRRCFKTSASGLAPLATPHNQSRQHHVHPSVRTSSCRPSTAVSPRSRDPIKFKGIRSDSDFKRDSKAKYGDAKHRAPPSHPPPAQRRKLRERKSSFTNEDAKTRRHPHRHPNDRDSICEDCR